MCFVIVLTFVLYVARDAFSISSGATYKAVPTLPVSELPRSFDPPAFFKPLPSPAPLIPPSVKIMLVCWSWHWSARKLVVAKPKSPIFTWSLESKKIFTGFRSRCIMPCWWMCDRPSAISRNNLQRRSLSAWSPSSMAVLRFKKIHC